VEQFPAFDVEASSSAFFCHACGAASSAWSASRCGATGVRWRSVRSGTQLRIQEGDSASDEEASDGDPVLATPARTTSVSFGDLVAENSELHKRVAALQRELAELEERFFDARRRPTAGSALLVSSAPSWDGEGLTPPSVVDDDIEAPRSARARLHWRLALRCAQLSVQRRRQRSIIASMLRAALRVAEEEAAVSRSATAFDDLQQRYRALQRLLEKERSEMHLEKERLKRASHALAQDKQELEEQLECMNAAKALVSRSRALTANLMSQLNDIDSDGEDLEELGEGYETLKQQLTESLSVQEDLTDLVATLQGSCEDLRAKLQQALAEEPARKAHRPVAAGGAAPSESDLSPAELWAMVLELRQQLDMACRSADMWKDRASQTWFSKMLGNMCAADRPSGTPAADAPTWSWNVLGSGSPGAGPGDDERQPPPAAGEALPPTQG